jgi:hypothetical protein
MRQQLILHQNIKIDIYNSLADLDTRYALLNVRHCGSKTLLFGML